MRQVEWWGQQVGVTDAFLRDVSEEMVRAHLIQSCAAAAGREGWTHLPGEEKVDIVHRDDERFFFDAERPPPGVSLAYVRIRCYAPQRDPGV